MHREQTIRLVYGGICIENDPQVTSPDSRGWKMEREGNAEQLVIQWMEGQAAPGAVLNLLACNC